MQGSVSNSNNPQDDKFFDFSFGKNKIFSKYIPSAIFFLFALFAFLACAFTIIKIKVGAEITDGTAFSYSYGGFSFLGSGTGFQLGDSDGKGASVLLRLICWLTFLGGLAALILSVVTLFMVNESAAKKIRKIVALVNLVILLLYLICGFIVVAKVKTILTEELGLSKTELAFVSIKTSAFVPFIICAFFALAYFLYPKMAEEKINAELLGISSSSDGTVRQSASSPKTYKSTMDKIALLKQYKELLDSGIITEEEFNEKKKDLID